jgi:hypothetical protein
VGAADATVQVPRACSALPRHLWAHCPALAPAALPLLCPSVSPKDESTIADLTGAQGISSGSVGVHQGEAVHLSPWAWRNAAPGPRSRFCGPSGLEAWLLVVQARVESAQASCLDLESAPPLLAVPDRIFAIPCPPGRTREMLAALAPEPRSRRKSYLKS